MSPFQKTKATLCTIVLSSLMGMTLHASQMDESVFDDQVDFSQMKKSVKKAFGKFRRKNPEGAQKRGMIETGLRPQFYENVECYDIDHHYAINYREYRGRDAFHGGIDIPAPKHTPVLAVANGVVVAKFMNLQNPKGIEIVLRHSPEDTGHSKWIYTQYTHMDEMPDLKIGQLVKMGEVIGSTGNTGISGKESQAKHGDSKYRSQEAMNQLMGKKKKHKHKKERRNLIHFGAMYSNSKKYLGSQKIFFPQDGYWMDPNALYLTTDTLDSFDLKELNESKKKVMIPYMLEDGTVYPKNTKVIWPYACKKM